MGSHQLHRRRPHLLAGHGFVNVIGHNDPYTTYAPLYPMALAAAGFGLFDPYAVAAPLNAALLGLTVLVMGQYFRRRLKSPFLLVWASAAVALSIPLIWAASFALSASLFILLTSLALIQCDKYLEKGQTSALILTAIFFRIGLANPLRRRRRAGRHRANAVIPARRNDDAKGATGFRLLADSRRPYVTMAAIQLSAHRRTHRQPAPG